MQEIIKLLKIITFITITTSGKICLGALLCFISFPTLDFGSINAYDGIAETSNTNVSVTCSTTSDAAVSYTIATPSSANRKMNNNSNTMSYDLYKDNAFSIRFDNKSIFSNSYMLSAGQMKTDYFTIYGRIPVQPVSVVGTYTDTISLILNY